MKLRYYLRGLGIGILVTALVMGITTKKQVPLTDAEIRAMATELGMVDGASVKLSEAPQNNRQNILPQETEKDVEPEEEAVTEEDAKPEEDAEPEEDAKPEEDAEPEEDAKPEEEAVTEKDAEPEEDAKPEEDAETASITIRSGSGSDTVCRQLEKAGLIENATAFDCYLIENGYSKRISVGTYEIEIGTSEEQIAKIITKTK